MGRKRGFMINTLKGVSDLEKDIRDAASLGANIFRFQLVLPDSETNPQEYWNWLQRKLWLLDNVLPLCYSLKCKIILDMHHPIGGSEPIKDWLGREQHPAENATISEELKLKVHRLFRYRKYKREFIKHWLFIAKKYKGHGVIWAFDLLNEPLTKKSSKWNKLALKLTKKIRKIDSKRKIIISSFYDDPREIKKLKPLPLKNIVYQIHNYMPWKNYSNKNQLKELFREARKFQRQNNARIYLGEFSKHRHDPTTTKYIKDSIEVFESYGWDWTYHAWREAWEWDAEPYSQRLDILKEAFKRNKNGR